MYSEYKKQNVKPKKDKKMKKMVFLSFMALVFGACSPSPTKEVIDQDGKVHTVLSLDADIRDYGNGIYYFDYTGDSFGRALSAFVVEHSELELVSFSGDGRGTYGIDLGYFVVFKEK